MEAYSVNPIDSYRFKVLECSSQCLHMSKYIMIIYQYIYMYTCVYIYINIYIYTHCFKGLGSRIGAKEGSPERSLEGRICTVQICADSHAT